MFFQKKLHATCEEVGQRLQNFMALDSLSNRLTSSTLSVSSEAFIDILDRLDQCMEYIGAHVSNTLFRMYFESSINRNCILLHGLMGCV